ncbi:MAG: tRNA pseudouridine(38-40) synthase TruA [Ilumatobacteraceae bacterium]
MSHPPDRPVGSEHHSDHHEPGATRRARFVVAYRGTTFHGVAPNEGVRTVLGELLGHVELVTRGRVEASVAGRTDAGVHAWGQVVSVDLPGATDLADLARRVNKLAAPDIAIRSAEWTAADFDARFSATWRRYRYQVWNESSPNPLAADLVWHVARPLDLTAMQRAAEDLIGEHDFSSFCRRPRPAPGSAPPSMVRRLTEATWVRSGSSPLLRFEVAASAFCHQQVRSMVGTLVDVGLGRLDATSIPAILAARDRAQAGSVAPPHGLVLWEVGYDGRRWDADR